MRTAGFIFAILLLPSGIADASIERTGGMALSRAAHTATLLADGRVVIIGGCCDSATGRPTVSSEIYDPTTGRFSKAGDMVSPRSGHVAVLLPSGKVLVTGGVSAGNTALRSAELFDPASGTFTATYGSMVAVRWEHTATLLPNGTVLLSGGQDGANRIATAELYDPLTDTFWPTAAMNEGRKDHTATLLFNGKVLLVGGDTTSSVDRNAELYDPAAETFTLVGRVRTYRSSVHSATRLADGMVLLAGGAGGQNGILQKSELFDPQSGAFLPLPDLPLPRRYHGAVLLPSGKVVMIGGDNPEALVSIDVFDPRSRSFRRAGEMRSQRWRHTTTMLNNGAVLIVGGFTQGAKERASTAELYVEDLSRRRAVRH